jgi:PKD repeat protein
MSARIWTLPARCALAAAALSFAMAISPAGAFAGGPGVTVIGSQLDTPFTISGDQITQGADVSSRSYTVRATPGAAGTRVQRGGMSVSSLLAQAGINVSAINRIAVSRGDGSDLVLTRADLTDPSRFKDGPPVITDTGSGTRILRPVRNLRDVNARDDVDSPGASPLLIRVDDASSIPVTAHATPLSVRTGKAVTFTATAQSSAGGLSYHWDFGDGATAEGRTVTHSFDSALDQQIQVTVTGNCANFCQGLDTVTVRVGNPKPGVNTPGATNPGSGTGNPLAPGNGGGSGEGGQGGSGGGSTPGATGNVDVQAALDKLARSRAADKAKAAALVKKAADAKKAAAAKLRAQRKAAADAAQQAAQPPPPAQPGVTTVTGILLTGQGAPLQGGLPALTETPSGSKKGPQAARGTSSPAPPSVPASVALAILVITGGALRERRVVKLRTA